MALPASGPISMSMINVELDNSATAKLSFQDIATGFDLDSPNYDDSVAGLGLGELYGDSAGSSTTATFSDFSVSSFSVNTQNGSITSAPAATAGSSPVPSLTVSYVSSPFSAVLTDTTRTANISFTCPASSSAGVTYDNAGSTLSGTVTSTQGAYQLEYDDWTGGIANINPNTGVVTITAGNDSNTGVGAISNTTTFSQTSNASPSAGQVYFNPTSFGTVGTNTSRTVNFTLGVPSTDLDGSGGQYGNVGGTVTGTKTFTQLPNETISLSGQGTGVDPLTWESGQSGTSNTKTIVIDVNTNSVGWSAAVLQSEGGMVDEEFHITKNSDGSGGSFSTTGTGDDVLYVFPTGSNTDVATRLAVVSVTTNAGANDNVALQQSGQVTFNTSPTPGSGAEMTFTNSGSLSSGDNTIDLTSNLAWSATITGSQFTFYEGSNFSNNNANAKTGTGNETFTISAANNTGAQKTGTFNIASTTAGTTEVKSFDIVQNANTLGIGIFTNLYGSMSGSMSALTVERTITQGSSSPYHYNPTFFGVAIQSSYATDYTAVISTTAYARISTTHDVSGNGAGSAVLSGLTATTSAVTNTNQTQFFVNTITETQHANTNQFTVTFTFDDSSTRSMTVTLQGSGTGGGGGGGMGGPE
tara:strand:- start:555 stop:2477 length:1923 start_codon:yes stop_codon:yes gene_type:complete